MDLDTDSDSNQEGGDLDDEEGGDEDDDDEDDDDDKDDGGAVKLIRPRRANADNDGNVNNDVSESSDSD
jgi:hypothetical protein